MSRFFFIADAPISYELRVDTLNNSLPGNADSAGVGGVCTVIGFWLPNRCLL
jgi:hypothetical protein